MSRPGQPKKNQKNQGQKTKTKKGGKDKMAIDDTSIYDPQRHYNILFPYIKHNIFL